MIQLHFILMVWDVFILIGNVNSLTLGFFDNDEMMALSMGYVKHWFRGTEYIIYELCVKTESQGKGIGSKIWKKNKGNP